jgi:endonuclease G
MRTNRLPLCGNPDCRRQAGGVYVANGVAFCSRECLEATVAREVREQNRPVEARIMGRRPAAIGLVCLAVVGCAVLALGTALAALVPVGRPMSSTGDLVRFAPSAEYRDLGGFLLAYDGRTRTARWTLERLTVGSLVRSASRDGEEFAADDQVPGEFAGWPADYRGSGYDLGHVVAAGNHMGDPRALRATFTVCNAMPQCPAVNRGIWRRLEKHVRGLVRPDNAVWVVTAPVWLPETMLETGGRRSHEYRIRAVGPGRVWVPTHCAKAILVEWADGIVSLRAWLIPNRPDVGDGSLDDYEVSIDTLENALGLDLWAALPGEVEADLEAIDP